MFIFMLLHFSQFILWLSLCVQCVQERTLQASVNLFTEQEKDQRVTLHNVCVPCDTVLV